MMDLCRVSQSFLFIAAAIAASLSTPSRADDSLVVQTWGEIATPPFDSADAERVRIWLPIERGGRCRVQIEIRDDSNQVVRRLVDRGLSKGYYNIYWNKKDDCGRFVAPGNYKYSVDDCDRRTFGQLEAKFHRWELASRLEPADTAAAVYDLELLADSAVVSAVVLNPRRNAIADLFVDSLMNHGRHLLQWIPTRKGYTGRYLLRVEVGGYVHPLAVIRPARQPDGAD